MLNSRGGIECDFTVTRLAADRFFIVTGTAFGNHDLGWIRKHAPEDGGVTVADVTSARACLGLWGPAARDILAPLTTDDVSDVAFPYLSARSIAVGNVPLLALRVTYVGELGWELYPPMEYGLTLWDILWEAGRSHGLVPGGYRGIDALRLEKGYRVWSSDITPEETPYEAGLGFAVKLDKGVDFIGREALARAKAVGPRKRLRCRVTSGGYGYAVERSIAYAYLPPDVPIGSRAEVEEFGTWTGCEVAREPLYDPAGERMRA